VTWVVWRHQRAENVLFAALLGGLALLLLLTGEHMRSVFHASGLSPCTSDAATLPTTCVLQANDYRIRFDGLNQLGPWLSRFVYEPASCFWPLQTIEAGIFLALSAALIALSVWWIKRRLA
jgi:hypothetical protein